MSSEPFIRRSMADGMDVVCASERRSSDRLSSMEGGTPLHTAGSHSSLRKPLVRRSRSEHSLTNKGEEAWPGGCTPRSVLRGKQWAWGRHIALIMCIAWPALAFIMVSQVPWLELSIHWATPNVQGMQWMFTNSKGGTCAAAARENHPQAQCGVPTLYNPTFQPGHPAVLRGPRYKDHDPGMIKALQLLKPGSGYTDCFEFVNEDFQDPEVGIKLTAHQGIDHTSDVNLDRLGFGFKAYTPGSLQHSNACWCDGSNEPSSQELTSIPESTRVLFIAGSQKAGTTWLFNALEAHPTFVGASHAYKQGPGPWSKELHFFNRWPMPPPEDFLPCFPTNVTDRPDGTMPDRVLVDGTPDYLFNSVAAPRIKAVVPQARFVIILRDPVARAYSAWQMTMREMCPEGTEDCPVKTFADGVQDELDADDARGCLFNLPCHYSHVDSSACNSLNDRDRQLLEQCNQHFGFGMLSVSNYAAQLAWWLNFFTPDRFLIISSQELRDEESSMKVLNRIVQHSGAQGAEPFTPEMVANVQGYDGSYSADTTHDESETILKLRKAFDKPMRDLDHLLTLYNLDDFFTGLAPEIS